ncbi:hypothetical protein ACHAXT_001359 [Thalassiosira profunda]
MGRKSKKKKGKGASRQPSANEKDTSAKSSTPPTAPGASCWICLEEGPDDAGNPLVRECSCRGDSAGFAHVSCLIEYAEKKCVSTIGTNQESFDAAWLKPFTVCPNCNQKYRGELAIELATARVDLVDKKQLDPVFRLAALQEKLATVVHHRRHSIATAEESEEIAKECTSIVEQMKEDTASWSTQPDEYVRASETSHFALLGKLYLSGEDAKCGRKALECFEKVKTVAPELFSCLDERIAEAKALCDGKEEKFDLGERVKGKNIEGLRRSYETAVKRYGEGSEKAIGQGQNLAIALKAALRIVEAERFLDKLAPLSRRILGPEHPYTECIEVTLRFVKERVVLVNRGNGLQLFIALRYDCSGKKCVIQGPLQSPKNATFEVNAYPVIPNFGTPVICHGLKSAAHLNGRVGEVRSVDREKDRFLVYLEGKEEPVLVKLENLRIAFDLPEPTTAGDSG